MENKTVVLDIDDSEDKVVVTFNSEKLEIEEFFHLNGHEFYYDCGCYRSFNDVTYSRLCNDIEEESRVSLDWAQVEDIYFAAASEAIEFFKDTLTELGYTVKHDPNLILNYSPQEAADKLKAAIAESQYLSKLRDGKYSQLFNALDIDVDELAAACKNNLLTKGSAAKNILEGEGLLDEALDAFENLDEDEFASDNYWIQSLIDCIYAMNVAAKRHALTDYDSVDKSNMSDDQVAELRREANRQV